MEETEPVTDGTYVVRNHRIVAEPNASNVSNGTNRSGLPKSGTSMRSSQSHHNSSSATGAGSHPSLPRMPPSVGSPEHAAAVKAAGARAHEGARNASGTVNVSKASPSN